MKIKPLARSISLSTLAVALSIPITAQAAFIEDSKANLELRNFYMNRDFRNASNESPSKAEEWAQGFLLRYESGFTEGTVGVGIDAYGFTGFKLDSGGGTSGTDLLLPKNRKNNVPSSYGEIGAAAKFRISETTLRAGTLMPKLPVVSAGDGRLLPQTFQGLQLTSHDIDNLTLNFGQLERDNQRNSTNNESMKISLNNGKRDTIKYSKTNKDVSSKFNFFSGSYNWSDQLATGYHFGQLDGVYKQHILNGVFTLPIANTQSLKVDLRYAKTKEDDNSGIDNNAFSSMLTYKLGYNSFGLGFQKMSGDTGYAYLKTTDPFLTNYIQQRDFANTDEKSWQARYDYNFAGLGVPGLSLMTRYVKGSNVYMGPNKSRGKEWERDTDITYVFQDGPMKNLGVKWRNSTLRSNVISDGDRDENRLIVSYTIPLL
ncbi:OprD family porin [Denitrificimonas sp. JX-1]|uniref:OprD family porin n=1 Tax=Denitrificimonas halotolerans TaxID=3098930 RepID=A0ABU5GQA9_9GAMM|nr:OprD family porin [Denitrificimonas sp. JX-1]MDY7219187.1 OprD family porin [Denitrificimonas sp. JX-1]